MKIHLRFSLLVIFWISVSLGLGACNSPTPPATATRPAPTSTPTATATPAPIARPTNTPLPSPTPTPIATPTPETISLLLWLPNTLPPAQLSLLQEEIAAFQQSRPQVNLEIQGYDDPETLSQAIIEGRVDYDIVLGTPDLLRPLQNAQRLQAINDLFPAETLNEFVASTLVGASRQGKVWGLPDTAGFHLLLFFNQDYVDTPPSTVDEMLALADDLHTRSRAGLVFNSRDPLWLLPWLWANGGWLTDGTGQATLDSAAMVETLRLYQRWFAEDGLSTSTYQEARRRFVEGEAAMLIDGEWAIEELRANAVDIPWRVALLPTLADQAAGPLVLGRYWAISADTTGDNALVAQSFVDYITRADYQLSRAEDFGLLPTRRSAMTQPAITTDPSLRISTQQLQRGQGVPLNAKVNALLAAMRPPLEALLTQNFSPEETAQQMQSNTQVSSE